MKLFCWIFAAAMLAGYACPRVAAHYGNLTALAVAIAIAVPFGFIGVSD